LSTNFNAINSPNYSTFNRRPPRPVIPVAKSINRATGRTSSRHLDLLDTALSPNALEPGSFVFVYPWYMFSIHAVGLTLACSGGDSAAR